MQETSAKLLGKWGWDHIDCSPFNGRIIREFETLDILSDSTLVIHKTDVSREATWSLEPRDNSVLYFLKVEPDAHNLSGLLLFCNDFLEVNNSYRGDCDLFLQKAL